VGVKWSWGDVRALEGIVWAVAVFGALWLYVALVPPVIRSVCGGCSELDVLMVGMFGIPGGLAVLAYLLVMCVAVVEHRRARKS
jgi:hypothetical protein